MNKIKYGVGKICGINNNSFFIYFEGKNYQGLTREHILNKEFYYNNNDMVFCRLNPLSPYGEVEYVYGVIPKKIKSYDKYLKIWVFIGLPLFSYILYYFLGVIK